MKNIHKMVSKIDDDILSEIISSCEKRMVSPFKKKEEVAAVEEPEAEEEVSSDEVEDMGPDELAKLIELYKQMKD